MDTGRETTFDFERTVELCVGLPVELAEGEAVHDSVWEAVVDGEPLGDGDGLFVRDGDADALSDDDDVGLGELVIDDEAVAVFETVVEPVLVGEMEVDADAETEAETEAVDEPVRLGDTVELVDAVKEGDELGDTDADGESVVELEMWMARGAERGTRIDYLRICWMFWVESPIKDRFGHARVVRITVAAAFKGCAPGEIKRLAGDFDAAGSKHCGTSVALHTAHCRA